MNKYDEIKKIIEKSADKINFAKFGYGVSEKWIIKTEKRLGFKLPKSYKWWLKNYGGGEIYGEEIFSIYEQDFDDIVGGDIVYMHELNKKNGNYLDYMLVICETDDKVFYFNTSQNIGEDEYPIYDFDSQKIYAVDFIDFLKKRITEN